MPSFSKGRSRFRVVAFLQQIMPQIGDQIAGRYRIERVLGEGGFGVVYVARQENLDREVAVKMLLPMALADRTAVQRFQREVDLVRRLEHPNTVRIFDRGETPQGLHFYVMEFVKGRTLAELISEDGPLPPGRVVAIAEQVLMSLGEAHEKGIVHRDLKPSNIMLTEVFGRGDFVKVLDFGIGKMIGSDATSGITTQGIVGTPFYMSPEQVKAVQDLDGRSDLYALGLIIHEMLTSRRAIDGPSPLEVVMAHARPDPVEIDPWVAAGPLGPVVLRATQKDRDARFVDAREMLEAIQAARPLVDGGPASGAVTPRSGPPGPVLTPPRVAPPVTPTAAAARTLSDPRRGAQTPAARRRPGLVIGLALAFAAAVLAVFFAVNKHPVVSEGSGGRASHPGVAGRELDAGGVETPDAGGPVAVADVGTATPPAGPIAITVDAGGATGGADGGPVASGPPDAGTASEDVQVAMVPGPDVEALRRQRQAVEIAEGQAFRAIGAGRRQGRLAADVMATHALTADLDAGQAAAQPDAAVALAEDAAAQEEAAEEPAGEVITATIRGTPATAHVRVGDETVCRRLPCEVTLPPGEGDVRATISAEGYDSDSVRLRREPGRSYHVELWRRYH